MRPKQAMILAINSSILVVLFVFSGWLYASSKEEVERQVAASLERAAKVAQSLAELRERELDGLARSVAVSPLLKSALMTGDRETIEDVLATIVRKNGVDAAAIVDGKGRTRWSSGPGSPEEAFRGSAPAADGALALASRPDRALLEAWTGITGVRYALKGPKGALAENVGDGDALAKAVGASPGVVSGASKWYAREAPLAGGRFTAALYDAYGPYWSAFERRRNRLLVLGAALFLAGLLMSILFAGLIERYASTDGEAAARPDWRKLLDEIERARDAKAP